MRKSLLSLFFLLGVHFLQAQADTIRLGGKTLELGSTGFPEQVDSLLAENIHFHFTRSSDGKDIRLKGGGIIFTERKPDLVKWTAIDSSEELNMRVLGSLGKEGRLSYKVSVTALRDLELKEITMHIPLRPDSNFNMQKDTGQEEHATVAIRTPYAFITYVLSGKEWANEGKGGITVGIKGRSLLANNFTGRHSMKKGDQLEYDFDLLLSK